MKENLELVEHKEIKAKTATRQNDVQQQIVVDMKLLKYHQRICQTALQRNCHNEQVRHKQHFPQLEFVTRNAIRTHNARQHFKKRFENRQNQTVGKHIKHVVFVETTFFDDFHFQQVENPCVIFPFPHAWQPQETV